MLVHKNFPPTSLIPHFKKKGFTKQNKKETTYDKHRQPYKLEIQSDNVRAPTHYSSPNPECTRKYWAERVTTLQEIGC